MNVFGNLPIANEIINVTNRVIHWCNKFIRCTILSYN